MANADNKHPERDTTPRRGDQTQGGISHEVAEKARRERDPEAGVPNGPQGGEPASVPTRRMPREDGDEDEHGFSGDDGRPVPADTSAQPAELAPGQAMTPDDDTGQANTHRPFDESDGKQASPPSIRQADEPSESGAAYQSGGTRGDMAQQVEERKVQEPGGGAPRHPTGAADPAPGSQPGRNRTPGDRQ